MKEAKKGICSKCKNYFYVHEHHILPKSIFGTGETALLCPNCHTHFHEYSKKRTKKPGNKKEALKIWIKWLTKITVTASIIILALILFLK